MATTTPRTATDAVPLLQRLKDTALGAVRRALGGHVQRRDSTQNVLLAIDPRHHLVLEILAHGAGGQQLFDELHVQRLVGVDLNGSDARTIRRQLGIVESQQHCNHPAAGTSSVVRESIQSKAIVFLLPPSPAVVQVLARVLGPSLAAPNPHLFSVLWLPAAAADTTLEMERQGLTGHVVQHDLPLGLLPVDAHVAALCHDRVFAELYVHQQPHALTEVVKSILAIEAQENVSIPSIVSLGAHAARVEHMLSLAHKMQQRPASTPSSNTPTAFDQLILFDRMEDPLTMLLTPMTYEGLLDALLGMNHGVVRYEKPSLATDSESDISESTRSDSSVGSGDGSTAAAGTTTKLVLNHNEELYETIRDVNINTLVSGGRLAEIAQELVIEARPRGTAAATPSASLPSSSPATTKATLAEITALLRKVPHLVQKKRALAHHLALVHEIHSRSQDRALQRCVDAEMTILSTGMKNQRLRLPRSAGSVPDVERFLEEALLREPPLLQADEVLRLLCLLSLVTGGLRPERLEWYRQQLCHTYGHDLLPLLLRLEQLELLSTSNKFEYPRRRRELELLREDALAGDEEGGNGERRGTDGGELVRRDINFMFPYTGYAPMSVRLVQKTLGMRFRSKDSSGPGRRSSSNHLVAEATGLFGPPPPAPGQRRRVLVYYIGGVTVAELAAYRLLNNTQSEVEFFIATTAICNGARLLRAM